MADLTKPTNNFHSNLMHAGVIGTPAPAVGMGVTILHYTDRSVGTITAVASPSCFTFTTDHTEADTSRGPLGIGHQSWKHTPRPDGHAYTAFLAKDGRWYIESTRPDGKRTRAKGHCRPLAIGRRDYYHDWEF